MSGDHMKQVVEAGVVALLLSFILASCGGGGGGDAPPPPPPVTLTSISLSPSNPSVALNGLLHLTVVGNYSNGTTQNLYSGASWVSSASSVADVDSAGLVTPVGNAGDTADISVTYDSKTASTTVTLTAALTTFSISGSSAPAVTDPLVAQQWALRNTGQTAFADNPGVANTGSLGTDINVDTVYSSYGIAGSGVVVAVVDSGLEIGHEDLSANVIALGSWDFVNNDTDPSPAGSTAADHGTSVSGLIAMTKQNATGGMGVAPEAQLKGFNFLASGYTPTYGDLIAALGGSSASPNSSDVQIFNQSFGTKNTTVLTIDATEEAQYAYGVTTLRDRKGAIYVKSAGNGWFNLSGTNCTSAIQTGISCQNANFDPNNTLPYNIVVGALNAKGLKSFYSSAGASLWVSAPGGEYGENNAVSGSGTPFTDPAMITTDRSGCTYGYSSGTAQTSTFDQGGGVNTFCNYTNSFNGSSSAAPMLSGVIALMLEANPALTWREVKDILARSAVRVDGGIAQVTTTVGGVPGFVVEQAWVQNAAGFWFHNWYGFGAVDAKAAVDMARTYVSGSMGTFANTGWIASPALSSAIPDNSTVGAGISLSIPMVGSAGIVETVQVKVTTASATPAGYNPDMGIEVTSPSGTKSILKNIRDGLLGSSLPGMVLSSNAFYGEPGAGTWSVRVIDGWAGNTQRLTGVQIRVYGH